MDLGYAGRTVGYELERWALCAICIRYGLYGFQVAGNDLIRCRCERGGSTGLATMAIGEADELESGWASFYEYSPADSR